MADFEIKGFGDDWLLIPTSRASQAWCRSNMTEDLPRSGEGYVVKEQRLLLILDQFMEKREGWFPW